MFFSTLPAATGREGSKRSRSGGALASSAGSPSSRRTCRTRGSGGRDQAQGEAGGVCAGEALGEEAADEIKASIVPRPAHMASSRSSIVTLVGGGRLVSVSETGGGVGLRPGDEDGVLGKGD